MTQNMQTPKAFDRLPSAMLGALLGGITGALLGMLIGAIFFAPPEPVNPEVNTAFCGILGIMQRALVVMAILIGLSIGAPCGSVLGAVVAVRAARARIAREAAQSAAMMTADTTGIEFPDSKGPSP